MPQAERRAPPSEHGESQLLRELHESTERLSLAISAAKLGDWAWDPSTDRVSLSPRAEQIFGLPPGEATTAASLLRLVHDDDRERVVAAVDRCARLRERYETEYRVRTADGGERWVFACGIAGGDVAGAARMVFGVVQDITERKEMESELQRRAVQLAEADRRKDEFLATLAHELRNPLAPLRTSLELLARPTIARETQDRARAIMSRQIAQMVRLIDDLLDIARIGTGRIELRKEDAELSDLVETAVEMARPNIKDKNQILSVELPPRGVRLHVDRTRLAQVLSNLLNNASRYTEPGRRIWLRAHLDTGGLTIAVRDEGIGIPQEQMADLFRMFNQLHDGPMPDHAGLGIGLTLARRLVELHGGRLHGRSDGAGEGSEFAVRLPVGALARD